MTSTTPGVVSLSAGCGLNRVLFRSRIPARLRPAPPARTAAVSLCSRTKPAALGDGRPRSRFPQTAPEGTTPA
ncbi:MAG: hypothetical protein QOF70_7843 [Acetobacteraceae bacterium]|nr:hypothetical protein [Acetobacteraceae bacterium]